jgi:hypothetical protein
MAIFFYTFKAYYPPANALSKSTRRIIRIYYKDIIRVKRLSLCIRTSVEAKIFVIYMLESVVIKGFFDLWF